MNIPDKQPIRILSVLFLLGLLSACSSSGSSSTDTSGNSGNNTDGQGSSTSSSEGDSVGDTMGSTAGNDTAGQTDGTTTNPPDENLTPPELTAAASLPIVDDSGDVSWSFDAQPSGLEVIVKPFVEMPLASNGSPARWNAMSSFNNRLFVVDEQDGRVYEITNGQAALWFDISNAIQSYTGRSLSINNVFHGGVRGIAFHPDFFSNGKFYASVMEQRPSDTTAHRYVSDNSGITADSVLIEWTADTSSFAIDTNSYREVFRVGVPEFDHPIKQIAFNGSVNAGEADFGNLYIAHGDGSVASTLAGTGQGNNALGKILRINPLQNGDQNYSIPVDNPFVTDGSLPNEVFSYGHRNPHHLAFSKAGHLLATEAGRDNIEEINLILKGRDYGWSQREGAFVHLDAGTLVAGIAELPADDAINGFEYPVVQFGHHGSRGTEFTGESLGGGFVVENGSALDGQFFYIDFPKSGLLFHSTLNDILQATTNGDPSELMTAKSSIATVTFDHDSSDSTPPLDNDLKQIVQSANGYVNTNDRLDVRIMQGPQGELYFMSKRNNMVYQVSNSLP